MIESWELRPLLPPVLVGVHTYETYTRATIQRGKLDPGIQLESETHTTPASYGQGEAEIIGMSARSGDARQVTTLPLAPDFAGRWYGTGFLSYADRAVTPGSMFTEGGAKLNLNIAATDWPPYSWSDDSVQPRCDNMITNKTPGCIYPGVMGLWLMDYSITGYAFAVHDYDALKSGLPGAYLSDSHLTRMSNDPARRRNSARACPVRIVVAGVLYPRPPSPTPGLPDLQCDEYPYASTYEGASTQNDNGPLPGSVPRTWTPARGSGSHGLNCQMGVQEHTGPNGWSRCYIAAAQNIAGGTELRRFYDGEQRMLDGDEFQILIGSGGGA